MTTSLRLLLEDFLGLMKEEGELDIFLPLLMSAMNHELIYRAQKGTRQYGVDISSIGQDENGQKVLFLWLVKCGDINRADWNSGPQSIRQSIDDVGDVYLRSHVAPQHRKLRRRLVVVTNGDFNASLTETITGYLELWSERHKAAVEQINGSALAALTERYLLDEYILPSESRAMLRRMLANVGSPELCISVGRSLIDSIMRNIQAPARSAGVRKKNLLLGLRGIRTALSVLQVWAQHEENLLAPYRLSEYAVLAVWAGLHQDMLKGESLPAQEFGLLLSQFADAGESYHRRLDMHYLTQDAFAHVLPDSLLISQTVFEELGRIGAQGCMWAAEAGRGNAVAELHAWRYADRLEALYQSHTCSQLPAYDHHSADVHIALLLLAVTGRLEIARQWVHQLCQRIGYAASVRKFWPMSAPFADAVLVRHGYEEMSDEFCSTSTLIPILLTWAAVLEMSDTYAFLREQVVPNVAGKTTPNFWSSDLGFDSVVANPRDLHEHGVGEGVLSVPDSPLEFLRVMSAPLEGVAPIGQAAWHRAQLAFIPMLAAVHWRSQLPRQMLVQQAMAFVGIKLCEPKNAAVKNGQMADA